jgi:hypothetical protein
MRSEGSEWVSDDEVVEAKDKRRGAPRDRVDACQTDWSFCGPGWPLLSLHPRAVARLRRRAHGAVVSRSSCFGYSFIGCGHPRSWAYRDQSMA